MINENNLPSVDVASSSTVDATSSSTVEMSTSQRKQLSDKYTPASASTAPATAVSTSAYANQGNCSSCTNDVHINEARDNRPSDTSAANDCINSVSSNDSHLTSGHFLPNNHPHHHQQQQQEQQQQQQQQQHCNNNSTTVRTGSTSIASSSASSSSSSESTVSHDHHVNSFHAGNYTSPIASTSRFTRPYSNVVNCNAHQQEQKQQLVSSHESEDDNVRPITAAKFKTSHLRHKQQQHQQQQQQHSSHVHDNINQGAISGNSSNNYSYLINIPGINLPLSANDPSIKTIKQHYYPEGAWGWVILAVASFVHFITAALTPTCGLLIVEIMNYFSPDQGIVSAVFLGALSTCVTLVTSPIFIAICKKKSLRLTAILGGLVTALGCLFTSFATQFHQLFFSFSIVMALGISMINIPAVMIVGSYFKKRRALVEIALHCSQGLGFAFMPLFVTFCIRGRNWRFGLQCMALVSVVAFFLATLYRPASLYHPQRRAILHLKSLQKRSRLKDEHLRMQGQSSIGSAGTTATVNTHNNHVNHHTINSQRHHSTSSAGVSGHVNKVTDKSIGIGFEKACYFDFSVLKSRTVQIILSGTCISYFGMTGPIFLTALMGKSDGLDYASLMRLQIFFGLSSVLGVLVFALIIVKNSVQCLISRQYLCQSSSLILAISSLAFTGFNDYSGYVLFSSIYGFFYGGYQYSLKMFIFDKVRARNFNRAWGFLQVAQSLPILFGMPIIMFLNDHFSSKIGFYLSSACLALGSIVFFLIDAHKASKSRHSKSVHKSEGHNYSIEKDRSTFNHMDHHQSHHNHHHRHNLHSGGSHGLANDAMLNGINLLTINDINSIYHAQNPLFRRSSSSSSSQQPAGASCRPIDGLMSTQARILHNYLRSLTNDTSRSLGASLEPSSNNSTLNNASLGKVSPCRLNNLSNSALCAHNIHTGTSNSGYKTAAPRSSRSNSLDPALCELTCISEEANFLDDINDMWDTDSGNLDAGKMSIGNCKSNKTMSTGEVVYANSCANNTKAGGSPSATACRVNEIDCEKDCRASECAKMCSDKKRESMRDDDCSVKIYDGEQCEDEASHFLMLIEKRKQQLLRAAAAVSASTSASASATEASGDSTLAAAAAASYSNKTHKCHLNENSDECTVSSREEIEVNNHEKRRSSLKRVPAMKDKMRVDECPPSHLRAPHVDVNETSHVTSTIKYKMPDEMKCDCSRASLQSTKVTALDNECDEKCTRRDKRRDKRSVQSGKMKRDESKSSLVNDDDDIFTSASHIIIRESSSESEDEEIRKIMCAKKLTANGESIYRKMSTKQCESMSDEDDDDDDDDDTTLPISLDRSESTAYKQQDTTIVYFTHRRDETHPSLSPQLNLPSSDVSCNSPVSTSTSPPPSCHNRQDN